MVNQLLKIALLPIWVSVY